jgi:DNA-binding IclR family transcriptional regulator
MKKKEDNQILVQALLKGLVILECFKNDQEEYGVTELGQLVDLPESGVQRILNTLEFTGYVYQNPLNRRYRLSPKIISQSNKAATFLRWKEMARKHMTALNELFGETVNLAIRDGDGAVYIEVVESRHVLRPNLVKGIRYPLHCSSLGQSLLLDMSETALLSVWPEQLEAHTAKTITSKQVMLEKIRQAKIQQYTVDDEEYQMGLLCIGAPVRGVGNRIVAAVSVSTPTVRMTPEKYEAIVTQIKETTRKISDDFQYLFSVEGKGTN